MRLITIQNPREFSASAPYYEHLIGAPCGSSQCDHDFNCGDPVFSFDVIDAEGEHTAACCSDSCRQRTIRSKLRAAERRREGLLCNCGATDDGNSTPTRHAPDCNYELDDGEVSDED